MGKYVRKQPYTRRKPYTVKLERLEKDPTEAEIEAACLLLQSTWSEQEKLSRRVWNIGIAGGGTRRPNVENLETTPIPFVNMRKLYG